MPQLTDQTSDDIRLKYASSLVRLARGVKAGMNRSELLVVCNSGHPYLNALYRAVVEALFVELNSLEEQ